MVIDPEKAMMVFPESERPFDLPVNETIIRDLMFGHPALFQWTDTDFDHGAATVSQFSRRFDNDGPFAGGSQFFKSALLKMPVTDLPGRSRDNRRVFKIRIRQRERLRFYLLRKEEKFPGLARGSSAMASICLKGGVFLITVHLFKYESGTQTGNPR